MPQRPHGTPARLPLGRRVPGPAFSLLMSGVCLALSTWIAWKHPLVVLTVASRAEQPLADGGGQRSIVDGSITRHAWGLFQVGRVPLHHVSAFTMHTASSPMGGHSEALHAVTRDGGLEVFGDEPAGLLRMVARLNSLLDQPAPPETTVHLAHWPWFILSWILLALGTLVLARNVVLVVWRRSRVNSQRD